MYINYVKVEIVTKINRNARQRRAARVYRNTTLLAREAGIDDWIVFIRKNKRKKAGFSIRDVCV